MLEEGFVEECWFIYGLRLGRIYMGFLRYHSSGTVASVDFDWHKALSPLFIGWYHSHPGIKALTPSEIDNSTMRSWIKGLARPLLCGIICAWEQQCYCYYKSGMSEKRESIICRRPVDAQILWPFFFGVREDKKIAIRV
jgi:hypothetical protein